MIYVAPSAVLVGDVTVEDAASIWHGAVLRGDFDSIVVARDSNIQANAVVHVDRGLPAVIGRRVTVGHAAVVHGCSVGDDCLVGMNATINSGAVIGSGSVVASGAVVRENAEFPADTLLAGGPARAIRTVGATLRGGVGLSWSSCGGGARGRGEGQPLTPRGHLAGGSAGPTDSHGRRDAPAADRVVVVDLSGARQGHASDASRDARRCVEAGLARSLRRIHPAPPRRVGT